MKQVATMVCNGRYKVLFDGKEYKVIRKWRELKEDGVHDRSKTMTKTDTLSMAMAYLSRIAFGEETK